VIEDMNFANVMPCRYSYNKIYLQNICDGCWYWSVGFRVLSTCQKLKVTVATKMHIINVTVISYGVSECEVW